MAVAYRAGMREYTITAVGQRLGRDKSRVSRAVARLGLGRAGVGKRIMLNRRELAILRAHFAEARSGNPNQRDSAGRYLPDTISGER